LSNPPRALAEEGGEKENNLAEPERGDEKDATTYR
jgi:hypothetical protein